MNGYTPDRPQRMAQMLAMQERNRSITAPPGQRDGMPAMRPSLAYSGATPNTASGVPPQMMNFNGPQMSPQPGIGRMGGVPGRQMGPPPMRQMAPQVGGVRRPQGIGSQGAPMARGMMTPQGGGYRGDFDYGQE
jgi:hypothetical protein